MSKFSAFPHVSEFGNPVVKIVMPHSQGEVEWPIEVGYDQHTVVDNEVLAVLSSGIDTIAAQVSIDPPSLESMGYCTLNALHDAQKLAREFRANHSLPPLPAIS